MIARQRKKRQKRMLRTFLSNGAGKLSKSANRLLILSLSSHSTPNCLATGGSKDHGFLNSSFARPLKSNKISTLLRPANSSKLIPRNKRSIRQRRQGVKTATLGSGSIRAVHG